MKAPDFWWHPPPISSIDGLKMTASRVFGFCFGQFTKMRMHNIGTKLDVPVICVGNFVAGGAGKTPTAIAISHFLLKKNLRPFFISRGYGRSQKGVYRVDPFHHDAFHVGDEALLLANIAPVIVGANRIQAAQMAIEEGATILVMDDGFQNPSLHKDISLVVVDSSQGTGNGYCIPAGPLRAPVEAQMPFANGVVVIGQGDAAISVIRTAARHGKPILHADLVPTITKEITLNPVLAFAGIGLPIKFINTLHQAGVVIGAEKSFPDHHPFSDEDAEDLLRLADQEGLLPVTTEKDMVRLQAHKNGPIAELAKRTISVPITLIFEDPNYLQIILQSAIEKN